jgi:site-specific recombinase XerD
VVQKLLGHEDIKPTMRYAHLAPGYLEGGVNSMYAIFSVTGKGGKNWP